MFIFGQSQFWATLGIVLNIIPAVVATALAIAVWPKKTQFGRAGVPVIAGLASTAVWCVALTTANNSQFLVIALEAARNLAWLWAIYRLFKGDGRHETLAPIRPVISILMTVEALHIIMGGAISGLGSRAIPFEFDVILSLATSIGGLVLVHNLYAGAQRDLRPVLRWPAIGLAVIWAFELNLYTVAYLMEAWPQQIASLRGLATLCGVSLLALGATKNPADLNLRPSRSVTFQSFSLIVIGGYFVMMVALAQWFAYFGGDFAPLVSMAFLTAAGGLALVVLPSARLRDRVRVTATKHFFQHRYDYREEWLRFTRTIGAAAGVEARPLAERVIQAVSDITESPAGLLLTPGEGGDLVLAARWNWRNIEVPAIAFPKGSLTEFERRVFVAELDEVRKGKGSRNPDLSIPAWLLREQRAWALVPLVHFERLVGLVVTARPSVARQFDWEDFDLLRVVGHQLASYLAESESQDALAEADRFDEFNRRIAFVMHDIKNLASQLSLLARNAEKHSDKKEFRDDMLVTLRNSADKLNGLLTRLSRYGNGAVDKLEEVAAHDVVTGVVDRYASQANVILSACEALVVVASRHSLEQVLVHLIQNAIDSSSSDAPIFISLRGEGLMAIFEIQDGGCGMSAEFVRTRLFKPFDSTKAGGFGIGAYEARELVRAMRGRIDVESHEGLGSRFIIRIPRVANAAHGTLASIGYRKATA